METENIFHFEKLVVYQKSLDYIDLAYQLCERFPQHELYGLTSQFRRAACSISLNIAEGSAGTKREFENFLRIASRSLKECVVCTTISLRRKYISKEDATDSRNKLTELSKMISGLKRSLGNNSND